MKKTFNIISLGCPRNTVDSEKIISEFTANGYTFKKENSSTDFLVINTCAFIEDAKKESIDAILSAIDAKKSGNIKTLVVAGCLVERYRKELEKEFKDIDEFRGVMKFNGRDKKVGAVSDRPLLTPKHYTYIKISEGCANRCTYCVIPHLKGSYKSRSVESIKKEALQLLDMGAR